MYFEVTLILSCTHPSHRIGTRLVLCAAPTPRGLYSCHNDGPMHIADLNEMPLLFLPPPGPAGVSTTPVASKASSSASPSLCTNGRSACFSALTYPVWYMPG